MYSNLGSLKQDQRAGAGGESFTGEGDCRSRGEYLQKNSSNVKAIFLSKTMIGKTIQRIVLPAIVLSYWFRLWSLQ
jgi:hypothetical protein